MGIIGWTIALPLHEETVSSMVFGCLITFRILVYMFTKDNFTHSGFVQENICIVFQIFKFSLLVTSSRIPTPQELAILITSKKIMN